MSDYANRKGVLLIVRLIIKTLLWIHLKGEKTADDAWFALITYRNRIGDEKGSASGISRLNVSSHALEPTGFAIIDRNLKNQGFQDLR